MVAQTILKPAEYRQIPTVDYCTWIFGNDTYDHDKPIYLDAHDSKQSISWNQARRVVRELTAGFRAKGVKVGDVICVHSHNNIYYNLINIAIVGVGGIFVGTNPSFTPTELEHFFELCKVQWVISEPALLHTIHQSVQTRGLSDSHIFAFCSLDESPPEGYEHWKVLLSHGEEDWVSFDDEERSKSTPVALMSTSGTTGLPKAAITSHYANISQHIVVDDTDKKPYEIRRLSCLPPFHAFAAPINNLAPLREGIPTYILPRFTMPEYLECVDKHQITETHLVNPIIHGILKLKPDDQRKLDPIRSVWAGGLPLDAELQNALLDVLNPEARLVQVYGMTEVGWLTTFHYPEKDTTGSVGRLLPNVEAKIVDENGESHNEDDFRGEVIVRSPSTTNGYLDNPKATNSTIIDGWLHTGDIGYQVDGKLYISDRVKDIIKVRGWQVSPTELEVTLIEHPAVKDAAVLGVDFDDGKGEVPRAYVVLHEDKEVEDKELQSFMGEMLAKYKQLAGGIKRVDNVPRTTIGKIKKGEFRAMIKTELEELKKAREGARENGNGSGADEKKNGEVHQDVANGETNGKGKTVREGDEDEERPAKKQKVLNGENGDAH